MNRSYSLINFTVKAKSCSQQNQGFKLLPRVTENTLIIFRIGLSDPRSKETFLVHVGEFSRTFVESVAAT